MKKQNRFFIDLAVITVLLMATLIFCGFKGETTLCYVNESGRPVNVTVTATGSGCTVLEPEGSAQPDFQVWIAPDTDAAVLLDASVAGESANVLRLSLGDNSLPDGVSVTQADTVIVSDSEVSVSPRLDISKSVADGTEFTFWLNALDTTSSEQSSPVSVIEISVTIIRSTAEPTVRYPLWVEGVRVTGKNKDNVLGDTAASVRFDPATCTLVLNNASITNWYDCDWGLCGIYSKLGVPLNLILKGTNTISMTGTPDNQNVCGIWLMGGLSVVNGDSDGAARLDINVPVSSANSSYIYGINTEGTDADAAIRVRSGNISIAAGGAEAGCYTSIAMHSRAGIVIEGGTVSGKNGAAAISYAFNTETSYITVPENYTITGAETVTGSFSSLVMSGKDPVVIAPAVESTVTFDANGGTGTMPSASDVYGVYYLPENGFTAPQFHTFKGWSPDSEGTQLIAEQSITVTGNMTLYAIWSPMRFTVTMTGAEQGNGTYDYGAVVTLTPAAAPQGSHFAGWRVTSGDVTIVNNAFIMPGSDVTGVAVYEKHSGEDDGDCTTALFCSCSHVLKFPMSHDFSGAYVNDGVYRWHECQNDGCTKTDEKKPVPTQITAQRLYGSNRCSTAAAISGAGFDSAENVVLASGDSYADALAGVPLAYALDAPILLVQNHTLSAETITELERLGAENVYILGGTAAVGDGVKTALEGLNYKVERIYGNSRFATSLRIAERLQSLCGAPDEVFFVCAENYPDALAVSGIAAAKGCPVVYVAGNGVLDSDIAAFVTACGAEKGTIIGGTAAIGAAAETGIANCGVDNVTRLYGSSRYETCIKINRAYAQLMTGSAICVATGINFPDALAGGVFAAKNGAPLLLVDAELSADHVSYLRNRGSDKVYVFGGTSAVSDKVMQDIVTTLEN